MNTMKYPPQSYSSMQFCSEVTYTTIVVGCCRDYNWHDIKFYVILSQLRLESQSYNHQSHSWPAPPPSIKRCFPAQVRPRRSHPGAASSPRSLLPGTPRDEKRGLPGWKTSWFCGFMLLQDGAPKIAELPKKSGFMVDITIVNRGYNGLETHL